MSSITTLSRVIVEANGQPIVTEDSVVLSEVRIQQRLSRPTLCELVFFDPLGTLSDEMVLAPGASLRVAVQDQSPDLFIGKVSAVEYGFEPSGGREVRARGYDLLQGLRQRQPVRTHVQVTFADLAREMVADAGLQVDAVETGPLCERIIQFQQSDLDLLIEVSERCGLYFTLRDTTLHLFSLSGIGEAIRVVLGKSLFEARIEKNVLHACHSVTVMGWDPWRVEPHAGQANTPRSGRHISAEVRAGRTGSTSKRTLTDAAVQNDRQAEALAQAHLDLCAAREVTLWGVAEGNPQLRPGARVEVSGTGPALDGRYVLTSVNHTIDVDHGFTSEISTPPPPPRPHQKGALAVWGVVTMVDDPEALGRIQVSLPAFNDVETGWMSVLSPGAGAKKGLMMIPDVGDCVLVLCADGDLAQGVALGGLYGAKGLPEEMIEGAAVRRFTLLSPGGQLVRLDDAQKSLRLENSEGSFIELLPEKVRLHSATHLEIEAPGQSIVIRGEKIDFQRG